MLSVGVRGMVMPVALLVPVPVIMGVILKRSTIGLAGPRAFQLAERAALSQSLDVMVVTFLGPPYILFKAQHLSSVLAEGAIHGGVSTEHLVHPLSECVHHHRVLAQVAGGEELHIEMVGRHQVGVLTDSTHEHPRK